MKNHVKGFAWFLNEGRSISELSEDRERPMVTGIAEILRGVKDLKNRAQLADEQIRGFERDGISFDYSEFMELCGL